jgi:hypothetical protein
VVAGQNAKEDVKSEALDILSDCITRFGPQLAPLHGSLKDALLPQVKTKLKHAGFRRLATRASLNLSSRTTTGTSTRQKTPPHPHQPTPQCHTVERPNPRGCKGPPREGCTKWMRKWPVKRHLRTKPRAEESKC